ncbi:MAG: Uroporphyrinogen decarboxylase [Candidatus Dichloromethanomonas elyunquensis]|nr:MAG: Uroporphyrinogen decarboxylase [Candidatus Dichloromethanomonas elyunquensis]
MNSLELTLAAVTFRQANRVPVMPQVFGHAATFAGAALEDYIKDGEVLASCQLTAQKYYGYDVVFSVMDVNVETEAIGSVLKYNRNDYATIERYALSVKDDFDRLELPDPEKAGRMPQMLKALKIMKRYLNNTVPIIGCVLGPMTLATQLLGMEEALFLAVDHPERFMQLLDYTTNVLIRFGTTQLKAGAHLPVVFEPSASPAVVPHQFFREFELPQLTKLFTALKKAGAVFNWLHIAGPTQPILPYYQQIGVDIANIDYYVSANEAIQLLGDVCVSGNIKPLDFVETSAAEIEKISKKLIDDFETRGGLILSSGCEIPPEAKAENIAALVGAVQ